MSTAGVRVGSRFSTFGRISGVKRNRKMRTAPTQDAGAVCLVFGYAPRMQGVEKRTGLGGEAALDWGLARGGLGGDGMGRGLEGELVGREVVAQDFE